ncbi:MAG: hypothetical protein Q8Q14_08565 [Gemmatimonadales bacterium]|nr:hypothetical protein [Gemmatimonadales bacterium]
MAVAGMHTNGFAGFGQSAVEWPRAIGPLDAGGATGFPARRRHSLGPIVAPPALATPPATDQAALALLEAIPALLSTSDANLRTYPVATRAIATADATWADTLTLQRAEFLERQAYPERWRGPMPKVAAFADAVHQWLVAGVPHGEQASPVQSITSELLHYVRAAATGQLPHAAVASAAFQAALRDAYELAWLTHHARQGHGEVWRVPVSTGSGSDVAWRYADEANTYFPAGFVARWRTDWIPGDHTVATAAFLENRLAGSVLGMRDELARAQVAPAPPVPRMMPGLPGRLPMRMATAALLGALGWMLWQRYGGAVRRRAGRVSLPWRRRGRRTESVAPASPREMILS